MQPWHDETTLRYMYHHKGMRQVEIADVMSCSKQTVYRWMKKLDIKTRCGGKSLRGDVNNEEKLRKLYHEKGLSLRDIADEFGVSDKAIYDRFNKFDISMRSKSEAAVNRCRSNPVPLDQTDKGYELWWHRYRSDFDSVAVHRLLAVAEFGYDETVDKVVHHVNHISWDNRHDNIELMENDEHARYHRKVEST